MQHSTVYFVQLHILGAVVIVYLASFRSQNQVTICYHSAANCRATTSSYMYMSQIMLNKFLLCISFLDVCSVYVISVICMLFTTDNACYVL